MKPLEKIIFATALAGAIILTGSGLYNSLRKIMPDNPQPQRRTLIFLEQPDETNAPANYENSNPLEYDNPRALRNPTNTPAIPTKMPEKNEQPTIQHNYEPTYRQFLS